jgi:hypothetical protein
LNDLLDSYQIPGIKPSLYSMEITVSDDGQDGPDRSL